MKDLYLFYLESFLDGIDCFPHGSICDLVDVVLIPEVDRDNVTFISKTSLYKVSGEADRTPLRILFVAFSLVFDLLLQSDASLKCFYVGKLAGNGKNSVAILNLCNGVVR